MNQFYRVYGLVIDERGDQQRIPVSDGFVAEFPTRDAARRAMRRTLKADVFALVRFSIRPRGGTYTTSETRWERDGERVHELV